MTVISASSIPNQPAVSAARRVLCVSSVTVGGSGRSQRDLASALVAEGRDVRFLADDGTDARPQRRMLKELADARVRFDGTPLVSPIEAARRRVGSRTKTTEIDGLRHELSRAPEYAFEHVVSSWRPDVVVVSSISRVSWRAIRTICRRRSIPTVLYLREAPAIGHLTAGLHADILLANSGTLVDDAARLGHHAALVPSLVDIEPMTTPSTRDVLLVVNPLPSHGLHVIAPLATARPDIPIVLQESWPLEGDDRTSVMRLTKEHENVTFRAFEPRPGQLFRDTRVLLAPHQVDNRPRTILEAQTNGLPVIASDLPGLVEAVGVGGALVDADAPGKDWADAVGRLWDDRGAWDDCAQLARAHAARPEVKPDQVAARFCELVDELVSHSLSNENDAI